MKVKFVTQEQLQAKKRISDSDKELIEKAVRLLRPQVGIHGEPDKKAQALRAYLVQLFAELVPDDELRADIEINAAAWCDGWTAGMAYVIGWIRRQELSDYSDLKNGDYEVYLVKKSKLETLEGER